MNKDKKTVVATIKKIWKNEKVWKIQTDKVELSLFISNVKFDTGLLQEGDSYSFTYMPKVSEYKGKQQITNWLNNVEFASANDSEDFSDVDEMVESVPVTNPPKSLKVPTTTTKDAIRITEQSIESQKIEQMHKDKTDSIRFGLATNMAAERIRGTYEVMAANGSCKDLTATETDNYLKAVAKSIIIETFKELGVTLPKSLNEIPF